MITVYIDKTTLRDRYIERINRLVIDNKDGRYRLLINGKPYEKTDIQFCSIDYKLIQLNNEPI
jgi:hypothetical protein